MKLTNPWIGYLERGYREIKNSLITKLKNIAPEVTDYSESNILIIIISMFAGLVEQLNYYIDTFTRESFLGSAQKFSSVVKLVRILDYRIKSYLSSSVDLYFTYVDGNGDPVQITEQGVVPAGTIVQTQNGIQFITLKNLNIGIGDTFGVVSAKQQEKILDQILGVTTNLPNQEYVIPGRYVHNSLELSLSNGDIFLLKSTLARSLPTDKHYVVNINEEKIPSIQFGDGVHGAKPAPNQNIIADYYITEGASSNDISPNTINLLVSDLVLPNPATGVQIRNDLQPIGGSDVESIEDIRMNAPLTIRTLEKAVTLQDYKDLVLQSDSVAKANVIYKCGKDIDVYIAPNGGGIASQALLDNTQEYLESVKMVTTRLNMKAAGTTPVVVILDVTARFRVDKIQTKIDIDNALGEEFSYENQDINGRVALSDITALVDNLPKVDTVDIVGLYTLPYPFPLGHLTALNWVRETLPTSNVKSKWKLVYTGTEFRLFRNDAFVANVPINVVYTDPSNLIKFKINPGAYSVSEVWEFTSYPYLRNIRMDDNTVPIVVAGQTTIINVI